MSVTVVSDAPALDALCERIAAADAVAIDTEFHNERTYTAHLMVVQIAFRDGVAIVDPLAALDLQPLAAALTHTEIVGHALTSDLKIFAEMFGVLPRAAFDTQVAAAFCGYGLSVSLADLVREMAGVSLRKSQTVSDWSRRPLSPKQIDYLVDDVRYLFTLRERLTAILQERGRLEWAIEECRSLVEIDRYRPDPRRLYQRVPGNARMNRRELGILRELAVLRDQVARERNVPLKYVVADDVLAGIVTLRPRSIDDLTQLRRLDAGMRKQLGPRILDAVARGEALPEDELPQRASRPLPPGREAFVATLAVLLGALAAENDLPPALLLPRAALERIARELPPDEQTFIDVLDLTPWRRDLVARPLWSLATGRNALRVAGYAQGVPRATFAE